jgi:SAM-dependent methyltransferase
MGTNHLDVGCGDTPRNPYNRDHLHGIDVAPRGDHPSATIRKANLFLEPIPYLDEYFDSVSAYDFLEHVPRVLPTADGAGTRFPFIELMNEMWRVLKPGGMLYASTPCYPGRELFSDPTHCNFITDDTLLYFTRPMLMARMYGFKGDFDVKRARFYMPGATYEPWERSFMDKLKRKLSVWATRPQGKASHFLWEFCANKPAAEPGRAP